MRTFLLTAVLVAVPAAGTRAACPPDLLSRSLEKGYSRDEVMRLGGGVDGRTGPAEAAPDAEAPPIIAAAQAKLEQLTNTLGARCQTNPGRTARGDGPCDLYDEYSGILNDWRARRGEGTGGGRAACRQRGAAGGGGPSPPPPSIP